MPLRYTRVVTRIVRAAVVLFAAVLATARAQEAWPGSWLPLYTQNWEDQWDADDGLTRWIDIDGNSYFASTGTSLFIHMDLDRDPVHRGDLRSGVWHVAIDVNGDGSIDWDIRVDGNTGELFTYYYNGSEIQDFYVNDPLSAGYVRENGSAIEIQVPYSALQAGGYSNNVDADTPVRIFCFTSETSGLNMYDASVGASTLSGGFSQSGVTTPGTAGGRGFICDSRDSSPYSSSGTWYVGETVTVSGYGWPPSTSSYYDGSSRNLRIEDASSAVFWTGTVTTDAGGNLSGAATWTLGTTAVSGVFTIAVEDPRNAGTWYDYDTFTIEVAEMDVQGNGSSIGNGDSTPDPSDDTDFGSADIATGAVSHTFTIGNTGAADLTLSGSPRVEITGSHASDFTVTAQPSTPVAAGGGTTTFTIEFDPSATGLRTATLSIDNDDPDENPYTFDIQGTGVSRPEMAVIGSGTEIINGDGTPDASDDTDFGSADIATGTVSHPFTVENTGSADLILSGDPRVEVTGAHASDFTVTAQPSSPVSSGGGITTFTIEFDPSDTGLRSATVSIANDDTDENPYTFAIQGTGTAYAEMDVKGNGQSISSGDSTPDAADDTDFGAADILVGSVSHTFTIESSGSAELNLTGSPEVVISGAHPADFTVTAQPSTPVAAGGGTTAFTIEFDPSDTGLRSASVSIANDDTDENPYTFDIQGTGTSGPEIDVQGGGVSIADGDSSPDVSDGTDFGSADLLMGSVSHTFTIENPGSEDILLSGSPRVAIGGAHASDFTVTAQPSSPVSSGGGTTTFTIEFDPTDTGLRTATVSISNNDSDENPYDFSIQGTGVSAPEMDVQGGGVSIVSGDDTPDAADNTDFGSVNTASGSQAHTFTIENSGSVDLLLNGSPRVDITGSHASDFTVTLQPVSPVSPGGGTTTFEITFDPSESGLRTASVSISNNDSDENPYTFGIQGLGTGSGEMAVTGNTLEISSGDMTPEAADGTDLGSADIGGATVSQSYWIENSGSGDLILTGSPRVSISGSHASDFTVTLQPSSPLAPGSSVECRIEFDPSATGLRSATVSIANDDADENPYLFAIQGTGTTEPEIDIKGNGVSIASGDNTPNPGDGTYLGDVDVNGGTALVTYTIDNLGSQALNLTGSPLVTLLGDDAVDFSVTQQPSTPVGAGGSVTFEITFDPSMIGLRTATVSVTSDDADENPYLFAIQGNGIGPGAPLACAPNFFHIYDTDGKITYLDASTNPYTYYVISTAGYRINAAGYNIEDGLIYAMERDAGIAGNHIIRIDATGAIAVLPTEAPFASWKGDCDLSGNYYCVDGPGNNFAVYDISEDNMSPALPISGASYAALDIAYMASTGRFYGVSNKTLYILNLPGGSCSTMPVTGRLADDYDGGINNGSWGASWTANDGYLYVGNNLSGRLYKVNVSTGSSVYIGTGTDNLSVNDGASCPLAAPPLPTSGQLGDRVWIDSDNDGIQDAGETGLGGVTVSLYESDDTFIASTTTASDGSYSFNNLSPSEYYLVFSNLPAGFQFAAQDQGGSDALDSDADPSTGRTANITVSVGVIEDRWDAGVITTGIGDRVWYDVDADGIQDAGETGVPNVTVQLYSVSQGMVIETTTTDAYGIYRFAGLSPDNYIVGFTDLPGGYVFSPPNQGGNDWIDSDVRSGLYYTAQYAISSNNFDATADAGIYQTSSPEMDVQGNGNSIPSGDTTPGVSDDTDFGSLLVASGSVTHTFTITNSDAADLTLNGVPQITITGTHASDFTVTAWPDNTVPNGSSTTFEITFDPGADGLRQAMVSIPNNDDDENPYTFAVQGTGLAPEMDVQGNGTSIADGDDTPDPADHTDFGSGDIDTDTVVRVFTIGNSGGADLDLTGSPLVQISGTHATDFSVTRQPASSTVGSGGGTVTFEVTFDPSAAGVRTAEISISNNDSDENPYHFSIQGTGTAAAEIDVQGNGLSIADGDNTPDPADDTEYGSVEVNQGIETHTFTIENQGSDILSLTGSPLIEIGGANAGDFLVSQQPAVDDVDPGGTVTFDITFNPTLAGLRTAIVSIASTDSDENPYTFTIQGNGWAAPEMDVQGNGISIADGDNTPDVSDDTDFGSIELSAGSIIHTFTIENIGSATLNLTGSPLIEITGAHASDFSVQTAPAAEIPESGGLTTFQVAFDPGGLGIRSAVISISNDDSDENPYTFAVQGTGTEDTAPQLVLTKEVSPTDPQPGIELTYTIYYSNTGNEEALNVVLVEEIPDNTTFISGSVVAAGMTVEYSHDGGSNYDSSPEAPVTHIRFSLNTNLDPAGSGSIVLKVVVN